MAAVAPGLAAKYQSPGCSGFSARGPTQESGGDVPPGPHSACVALSLLPGAGGPMGARQAGQRVLLGVLCWGCLAASAPQEPADGSLLPWHRGHPGVPGSSRGAGVARGVPAWYRVPVYCPRNVTAPGELPGLFCGEGVARGPVGEGSDSEVRSSAGLSRGSDADLPLLVGAAPGAALPRTGGLGSPEGAVSLGDDGPLATGCLLPGVARGTAFPSG